MDVAADGSPTVINIHERISNLGVMKIGNPNPANNANLTVNIRHFIGGGIEWIADMVYNNFWQFIIADTVAAHRPINPDCGALYIYNGKVLLEGGLYGNVLDPDVWPSSNPRGVHIGRPSATGGASGPKAQLVFMMSEESRTALLNGNVGAKNVDVSISLNHSPITLHENGQVIVDKNKTIAPNITYTQTYDLTNPSGSDYWSVPNTVFQMGSETSKVTLAENSYADAGLSYLEERNSIDDVTGNFAMLSGSLLRFDQYCDYDYIFLGNGSTGAPDALFETQRLYFYQGDGTDENIPSTVMYTTYRTSEFGEVDTHEIMGFDVDTNSTGEIAMTPEKAKRQARYGRLTLVYPPPIRTPSEMADKRPVIIGGQTGNALHMAIYQYKEDEAEHYTFNKELIL